MLFNHRRQSQDRVQRQRMLQRTGGAKLWVDTYTAGMFSAESREQLEIDDQCLEYAADGEFCFVEKENPGTVEEKIEKIKMCIRDRCVSIQHLIQFGASYMFHLDFQAADFLLHLDDGALHL